MLDFYLYVVKSHLEQGLTISGLFFAFFQNNIIFREKDGIWAFLAWLQILAETKLSVEDIVKQHWKTYGRNVFTRWEMTDFFQSIIFRYDYENVDAAGANLMMNFLEPQLPGYIGKTLTANNVGFKIIKADNYEYKDPIDGSVAKKQVWGSTFF